MEEVTLKNPIIPSNARLIEKSLVSIRCPTCPKVFNMFSPQSKGEKSLFIGKFRSRVYIYLLWECHICGKDTSLAYPIGYRLGRTLIDSSKKITSYHYMIPLRRHTWVSSSKISYQILRSKQGSLNDLHPVK